MEHQNEFLPPALSKLLVQLDNGWQPADFLLPTFPVIKVNQRPWPGPVLGIEQDGENLIIHLQAHRQEWQSLSNLHVTAYSEGEGRLEARNSSLSIAYGEPLTVTLTCKQWSYTPLISPVLWVAPLQQVTDINTPGNLLTKRRQGSEISRSSITGLRLASEHLAFYILNTQRKGGNKQALMAIESLGDRPLTSESVSLELPLLRVVLSTPIRPDVFYGLNADGLTVAALAAPHEQAALPVNDSNLSPVPTSYFDIQSRTTWLAPFYRKLHEANAATSGISPVSFSLKRYGHSIAPLDVDTQFELVAGAVWILTNHLSGVSEEVNYFSYLEIQELSKREKAVNPVRALTWLTETYGPDGEEVGKELLAALQELMYGTLADYRAADASQHVVLQRYNRVQLLRRAYAVLLGQAIGYQGRLKLFEPIAEGPDRIWSRGKSENRRVGWLPMPDDSTEDTAEAHQVFMAEADITGLSVWPNFELPTLPPDDLVRAFTVFAEELRQQTQGRVYARLRRLPQRGESPVQLSFRLLLSRAPATQVALFTMQLLKKGFEVRGWSDKVIRVTTPKGLDKFQQQLLDSREFKYEVERLVLSRVEAAVYRQDTYRFYVAQPCAQSLLRTQQI
ncbi:hypothetical protein [Hymenobacter metallicola]|uniref:Uncharacterized protein n=1 Tax=Hymenobacter metallicola TaxID=2563114 RepID=A0A4Z0PZK1_9BACT|nr:hypothetical protein [Hymenobacter metallicola]TGE22744.1 hypothetical protein E5K02_23740 [Hymenobacter metallicola]